MSDHEAAAAQSSSLSPERPTVSTPDQGSVKRSRGRPRKYHTEAEREEAKRRYRENHKSKTANGGGTARDATSPQQSSPLPKQQDVEELWKAIHDLQEEVAGLKQQLSLKEATNPVKRRKV